VIYRKEVKLVTDTPQNVYDYYAKWARKTLTDLVQNYEELSTKITLSQKSDPWYLYLDWRAITEEEFYCLSVLIAYIERYSYKYVFRWESPEYLWMYEEMVFQYLLCAKRFKNSSKGKFWSILCERKWIDSSTIPMFTGGLLPITEFEGNYLKQFKGWIKVHYTLRYLTSKKIRKTERIRGYRDHGSASSESERARRKANTDPLKGIDQDGRVVDWNLYIDSRRFIHQQRQDLESD
jgi:hypothetical protein